MIDETDAISPWQMLRALPYPLALAYQRYASVADRDLVRKLKAMSAVAEVSTRYLTIVLTADHLRRGGEPTVPRWIEQLPVGKGIEAGRWIAALREVAGLAMRRPSFMPEAVTMLREASSFQLLIDLNDIRNDWVHPKGAIELADDELDALLRRGKPLIAQWLARIRFLTRYALCLSLLDDLFDRSDTPTKAYYVKRLMGLEGDHRDLRVRTGEVLLDGQPFLLNPAADDVLYLWPLMIASDPEEDDIGRLLMFERLLRANFDSAEYVAIGQRHSMERSEADLHRDVLWIDREYARLRMPQLASGALSAVNVAPVDPMLGRTIGAVRSYTLRRHLGSGGMGTVYLATDAEEREYAVKLLRVSEGAMLRRFEREIDGLRKLAQVAGIVSLLDWGSAVADDGAELRFYVMEYSERGDLGTFIRNSCVSLEQSTDPLDWDLEPRLEIIERIADAMAALHAAKIIHRDIKPQNILLMNDGSIRIADLGLIRDLTRTRGETQAGSVIGTIEYMPPEQLYFSPDEPITPAADVYAFGVVLFELMFGRRPKVTDPTNPLRREQRAMQLLPTPLRNLVTRCMYVQPVQRYADGGQLRQAISSTFPSLRRAWLTVQTEPDDAVIYVDGERRYAGRKIELASGAHVLSAVFGGDLVFPTTVLRLPPQAAAEKLLTLRRRDQLTMDAGDEPASDVVQRYLARIDTQMVTRSVGYGTVRVLDDKNSYLVWQELKRDFGRKPIPSLIALLHAPEAELRTRALRLLLHYGVDDPASVDHAAIQARLRADSVPLILNMWVDYLQRTPEAYWPLLLDLLTTDVKGHLAGVPHVVRRLAEKKPEIVEAILRTLPDVGNPTTRTEVVRVLGGMHPQATAALMKLAAHDDSPNVREAAVWGLAASPPKEAFDVVLQVLRSDTAMAVRIAAARALLTIDRERAIAAFGKLESDAGVSAAVAEARRYEK